MERAMGRVAALGILSLALLPACAAEMAPAAPPRTAAAETAGAPEPRPDWSTGLPNLLPGIRACLGETGGQAVAVTKAWPIATGLTGVRLLEAGGERLDCVAAADGAGVLLTERVWSVSRLPGERDPLFTPASAAEPRHASCLQVAAARDRAGDGVGWLSYDVCREPRAAGPSAELEEPRRPARQGGEG
jgi:hypothetical protein